MMIQIPIFVMQQQAIAKEKHQKPGKKQEERLGAVETKDERDITKDDKKQMIVLRDVLDCTQKIESVVL